MGALFGDAHANGALCKKGVRPEAGTFTFCFGTRPLGSLERSAGGRRALAHDPGKRYLLLHSIASKQQRGGMALLVDIDPRRRHASSHGSDADRHNASAPP